jgi:predicted RNA-binding protein YlqC (UPF0109 family)
MKLETDTRSDLLEKLLRDVLRGFIGHPKELTIQTTRVGAMLDVQLRAHPDDVPKLIGKVGKNLTALNVLFSQIARKMRMDVKIAVDDWVTRSAHPTNRAFVPKTNWPRQDFIATLRDVLIGFCQFEPRIKEKIAPKREFLYGDSKVVVQESSTFYITPEFEDLPLFRRELEVSLEVLFRAIGQQQGRRVSLSFVN